MSQTTEKSRTGRPATSRGRYHTRKTGKSGRASDFFDPVFQAISKKPGFGTGSTYALGRGIEYYDRPAVEKIMSDLRAHDDKFSALILAVAQSFPFQNRRAPSSPPLSKNE